MRKLLWSIVLVACGSKAPPPAAEPVGNVAPVTSAPPPAPAELPGLDATVCEQRTNTINSVPLTEAQAPKRRGSNVTSLAAAVNSKEKPIEVCGVGSEYRWLASARCNGDSKPTERPQRTGSVGSGGACGSIIDLYEVKCPEKTYEVYMDMYMCGPNEKDR